MATFAERLTELRNERELSQDAISTELGVSKNSIYYYENNKRVPDANTIVKFARFFGVTSDYLLGLEDSRTHDGQAVLNKLGLSDKAIRVLSNNNPKAHPECIARNGLRACKNDLPDGAYSTFINALLEWEALGLANDFSVMMELLGDQSITYDNDGTPSESRDDSIFNSADYLSYRCLKQFIVFLDIAKENIPPENIEGGDLYEMIAKLREKEE